MAAAVALVTNAVYLRALIVPSSIKRTLLVNLLAAALLIAGCVLGSSAIGETSVSIDLAIAALFSALAAFGAAVATYVIKELLSRPRR